jgi:ABC-type microcin C transport system permease subunit YejE
MSGIDFTLSPVNDKPSRTYRKGSIYDPIIDEFLASDMNIVIVNAEKYNANYLRLQLMNRIVRRNLHSKLLASVVSDKTYLEKI